MKILVVCQYYYPEEFQINDICVELVRRGHKITVLTGLPNYPTGNIPLEYQKGAKRHEFVNGVEVIRCFEIPRQKGIVGLVKNYLSFCVSASLKTGFLKKDFDVIYVYQLSPVLMALPGLLLKRLTGKKLFLYCCDLWPESIKILAKNESSFIFKFGKIISSYIYKRCDYIGIQSNAFVEYFKDVHALAEERLKYIPQFANEEYLEQDFTKQHKGTNFVFLGNVGIAQDLECVVKAVEKNQDILDFKIHIVGDGSYLEELKYLVHSSELDDFFAFYGRQPMASMPKYYKLADACLLTLSGDSIIGHTIPSKLQGYMAAGKAVIAAIDGPARQVIDDSGCGAAVSAGDSVGLGEIMRDFLLHREKYTNCGEAGREYFQQNFTKKQYVDTTENILMDMAGR